MTPQTARVAEVPALVRQQIDLLACPVCQSRLELLDGPRPFRCVNCQAGFACADGIPLLYSSSEPTKGADVTETVKAFYEDTPFPNYEDVDSPERLRVSAEAGLFARLLNDEIPHGAKVLECGCGTGQLTNFLGMAWGRAVFGTDVCLNSLRLGESFRERNQILGAAFVQMNLFRPAFRPESFDVVIANGVLHHTADPFAGFQSILRCLKREGFIIIGLYNTFGRLTTDFRRLVFRLTGDRLQSLDPRLRRVRLNTVRRQAWFRDQYRHPHESKHSIGEVLTWFEDTGVEFVNSIPKCSAVRLFSPDEKLFCSSPAGSALEHFIVQTAMLLGGGREGGFFTMIGRKKA